jgi:hypothetical protein
MSETTAGTPAILKDTHTWYFALQSLSWRVKGAQLPKWDDLTQSQKVEISEWFYSTYIDIVGLLEPKPEKTETDELRAEYYDDIAKECNV